MASYVTAARALYRAVCPEAGAPRLVRKLGTAELSCGSARALEDLGIAEVRAAVTLGDPLRAIHAFDLAEKPPAAKTASRAAEAAGWITQAWPAMTVQTSRYAAAVPKFDASPEPSWGALAFDVQGRLLMKTAAGVVRFDPATGDEVEAEGRAAWKSTVVSPSGDVRWIKTYNPCDQISLVATFTTDDEGNMKSVTLPIAAPKCAGTKGEQVRALPIAWGPQGLFAVIGREPVTIAGDLSRATPADPKASYVDGAPVAVGAPRRPTARCGSSPRRWASWCTARRPRSGAPRSSTAPMRSSKTAWPPTTAARSRASTASASGWGPSMRRELALSAFLVAALAAHPARAEEVEASAQCEPAAAPGRVHCEVVVKPGSGRSVRWAEVQLVRASAFLVPLKGRLGPREAEVKDEVWRFPFALAAREKGAGEVEVRVRAVACEGERCAPSISSWWPA